MKIIWLNTSSSIVQHCWGQSMVIDTIIPDTFWLFNIAMENGPFVDDLWSQKYMVSMARVLNGTFNLSDGQVPIDTHISLHKISE